MISYQKNLLCYQNKSSIRNYSKTVKSEVINVEFLSRDLPLNNSVIMVKWKCLKLLYSSEAMCRIVRLKYLILETPYTFFSIFSWYYSFTRLALYHLCFQVLTTITFPIFIFWIFQPFFFCVCFYNFKKENIYFKIFLVLI